MSLPNRFKTARLTNATQGSTIDDEIGLLERAICDILGIPIDTDITTALFTAVAGGLTNIALADAAANPTSVGQLQRNGTALLWHNGERAIELQPAGEYKWLAAGSAPTGWAPCDGSAISRTTFARLFARIGTAFGVGDGSTTFNLPNIASRVMIGRDIADADFTPVGKTGGAKQISSNHTHSLSAHGHAYGGTFTTSDASAASGLVAGGGLPAVVSHTHDVGIGGSTGSPSLDATGPSTLPVTSVVQPYVVADCYIST